MKNIFFKVLAVLFLVFNASQYLQAQNADNRTLLTINNKDVQDEGEYTISLQGYHVDNCFKNLNITYEELTQLEQPKLITTSVRDVVEEYLRNHQNISSNIESRLTYIK